MRSHWRGNVILVPERKRGIDTGIQGKFDSLFDLDIRVKPEYGFAVFLFYLQSKDEICALFSPYLIEIAQ